MGVSFASGVYDDCVFLFEGGRDGFNGVAADGFLQKGEFVDELHAGVPTHDNNQSTFSGAKTNFVACVDDVNFHAAGKGVQRLPYLRMKTHTWTTNGGSVTNFNYGTVYAPCIGTACPTNVYSAVFRVRRDQPNPFGQIAWFACFGYNKNLNGQGFLLGFTPSGALTTHATGSSSPGNIAMSAAQLTPIGRWVDVGVVVTTNVVRYHVAFPGLDTTSAQNGPSQIYHFSQTFAKVTLEDDANYNKPPNLTMLGSAIHFGGQDSGGDKSAATSGNHLKYFDGSFRRIAFWNRALNNREIAEAFAFPRPSHVVLGGQNGHADEFGQADRSEATIGPDLVSRDSWTNFPASFRSGDRRTIKFNMGADDAKLAQLLVVKSLAGSPAASFRISLNGNVLASSALMPAGGKLKFPIRALRNQARFLTGENTLVLERVDAGDPVRIDAVWLGGSWYVGAKDDRKVTDFGWHYVTSYLDYFDTFSFARALNNASTKNYTFGTCAPTDVSESYPVRYCLRYKVEGCTDSAAKLSLIVDEATTYDFGNCSTGYTDCWVPLDPGEHTLHLQSVGTNGVYWLDCHTLTFDPPPNGTMFLLR